MIADIGKDSLMILKSYVDSLVGRQQRHPSGLLGRVIGARMARQHTPETLWTISLLDVAPRDRMLDIGCGAGRAIELIAAQTPQAQVSGVDLSPAMVAAAMRRNRQAVRVGRVEVRQGDVASLPFADRMFDKVLSIHTLYFWADPQRAIAQIRRVLKPGGWLVLTFSPGKVGAVDDDACRDMVERRIIPSMQRQGFVTIRQERGPDSRQYRSMAIVGALRRQA